MKILDLSAGNRAVWFDRTHPLADYIDIRPEVKPDFVMDSRALPENFTGVYSLVLFDPPHANFGANGNMAKNYGHHTAAGIREILKGTAREAHRVTKPNALMAFKWNDHDITLKTALAHLDPYWEPLFGQKTSVRTGRASTTYWVQLIRKDIP